MIKLKDKCYLLELLMIFGFSFFFISCDEVQYPVDKQDPESYFLDIGESALNLTHEYGKSQADPYLFYQGEYRNIYVYGKLEANNTYIEKVWSLKPDGNVEQTTDLGSGQNKYYYDGNDKTKQYTAPVWIKGREDFEIGVVYYATVRFGISSSSLGYSTVWIKNISARDYAIEYICQSSYNMVPRGYNMENRLEIAFQGAHTTIKPFTDGITPLTPIVSSIPDEIVIVQRDETGSDRALWFYCWGNSSRPEGDPDNYPALIVAIKDWKIFDFSGNEVTPVDVLGWTAGGSQKRCSVILVDRIARQTELTPEQIKYDFDRIVIHELAHQRGLMLDNNHESGHNGAYKRSCIMFKANEPQFQYADTLKMYREKPAFCEGHKQKLLNIHLVNSN